MSAPVIDILLDPIVAVVAPFPGVALAMVGEHDLSTVDALTRDLSLLIDHGEQRPVVDLSGVTFMDASIVGLLMRTNRRLQGESRELVLWAPSPSARRVLELCEHVNPLGLCVVPGPISSGYGPP